MRENLKHPHNEIPVMLFVLKSFAVKVWQLNAATEKSWIKKYNTLKVNNKHLHNRDCLKSSTHSELVELFVNVRHQKPIYRLFFTISTSWMTDRLRRCGTSAEIYVSTLQLSAEIVKKNAY